MLHHRHFAVLATRGIKKKTCSTLLSRYPNAPRHGTHAKPAVLPSSKLYLRHPVLKVESIPCLIHLDPLTAFESLVKTSRVGVRINEPSTVSIVIAASAILAGISNLPTNPTSGAQMAKLMRESTD